MKPIYLDYNATTPVDPRVLAAMLPYLREDFGNPSSDHAYGHAARQTVATARAQVAALIGAVAENIVFTASATEANNLALPGAARCHASAARLLISRIGCVSDSVTHLSKPRMVRYGAKRCA